MERFSSPSRDAAERLLIDDDQQRTAHEHAQRQAAASAQASRVVSFTSPLLDRTEHCEIHGDYTNRGRRLGKKEIWIGCPTCSDERERAKQAEAEAERKRREAERRAADAKAAGVPKRFRGCSFENYFAVTAEQTEELTVAMEFATEISTGRSNGKGLVLAGKPGTGKTHIATAIVQHLLDRGFKARYVSSAGLIDMIRATWGKGAAKTTEQVVDELGERLDLLVVDELGASGGSDNEKDILFRILDKRYAEVMPTVLLTNLGSKEFASFVGDRILDRMREAYRWRQYRWVSYRQTGAQEDPPHAGQEAL